jgi:hypothetical protein
VTDDDRVPQEERRPGSLRRNRYWDSATPLGRVSNQWPSSRKRIGFRDDAT